MALQPKLRRTYQISGKFLTNLLVKVRQRQTITKVLESRTLVDKEYAYII